MVSYIDNTSLPSTETPGKPYPSARTERSDTPACLVRFVELLVEGGLPDGVVNVVTGSGGEVGNAIVDHPDVRVISFTGHTDTGVEISTRAAKTLKRVSLELGGKNPIVIWEDADLDLALDSVVWSAFGTSGQRCTAASRLIVHRAIHDDFVHRLQQRVAKLVLGDGLDEKTDVGPVINDRAVERIERSPARLVTDGVDRWPFVRRRHTEFDLAPDGTIRGRACYTDVASFFINSKAGRFEDYLMVDVWDFLFEHFPLLPELGIVARAEINPVVLRPVDGAGKMCAATIQNE